MSLIIPDWVPKSAADAAVNRTFDLMGFSKPAAVIALHKVVAQ